MKNGEGVEFVDPSPEYWDEYSNLQDVKHKLIESYLNGWFPKLGSWAGKIIYFDTHAGKGSYRSGQYGSPLVALRTLLKHSYQAKLLERSKVHFLFIEADKENFRALQTEISKLKLPKNIFVHPYQGDCFELLSGQITAIKESKKQIAPSFFFIDPYGFKVPGELLRELMRYQQVELFINIIWRELDMAMRGKKAPGMRETLNSIFCDSSWEEVVTSSDFDERADQATNLLKEKIGARWGTYIRMLGTNGVTRYLLLHLTNHDSGRELMKDCIWKVCPDGGFYARKSDNPAQQFLITPEPDLKPLKEWVQQKLSHQAIRWKDLADELKPQLWREPHLNDVIRELRQSGVIAGTDYEGKFVPKANPLLSLAKK